MAEKDEISIDFGKITNFFKKKGKKPEKEESHESHHAKKEDEISFDFDSIKNFFARNHKVFLILIPLLIAIFAGTYIRMQSMQLPATDTWAEQTVDNYYKTQIKSDITKQYPNLPDANKDTLVEQEFQKFTAQSKDQIDANVKSLSENYKQQFKDENSYNYMPDIDPYTYLRYARNYIEHGYIGDEIINGSQWDNHMVAPLGRQMSTQPHAYVLAYTYKILHAFNSKITLMQSAGYFPVIFAILSIIPAFFIGRRLGGPVGGFFSAIFVAVSTAFVNRTLWGHADTDAYAIFFPLFIAWFFLEALDKKETIKQVIYAALSGLFIAGFALAWSGWWYVLDFILGAAGLYLIYLLIVQSGEGLSFEKLRKNSKIANLVTILIVFLVVSAVFVSVAASFTTFYSSVMQPISFSKLKIASHATLWPNVYTTVAELNAASLGDIIGSIGGNYMFLISLLGILAMFFIKDREGKTDTKYFVYAFLFILWYIGIIYASTKGIRFTMMLVPPFAFGFAAAISFVFNKGGDYFKKGLEIPKWATAILIIAISLLFFVYPAVKASLSVASNDIPMISDAWYNSLNKIRLESAPNAIVNSWWDFGHHFKYYADRAVTFDGASQNSPMAHWIGKALLTDDEDLAVGILRMLDCGSNKAFEALDSHINDTSASVQMLYKIVVLGRTDAKSYLIGKKLSESQAESVLQYTHCSPPEDYFITSGDMVGKGGVWAHFGSWNFNRADIWVYAKNMPKDEAIKFIAKSSNISEKDAEQLYYEVLAIANENDANTWIAPWPNYAGTAGCSGAENETVQCANGIEINLGKNEASVPTEQGTMPPSSLVYKKGSEITEIKYNTSFAYSIAYFGSQIAVMDPALAKSMFTTLFYFEGAGMKHFEKFSDETSVTGDRIIVWKIQWE
jgi:dolichyl-diphosphooligosaccharide--protein glycosyltransferase